MKTYIKKDLIDRVVERTGARQVEVSRVVDALFRVMRDTMSSACPECRIEIRDFGVFEVKQTCAKPKARNPRTNELVYVPAHRKTHFRPGKHLKAALRSLCDSPEAETIIEQLQVQTPRMDAFAASGEIIEY